VIYDYSGWAHRRKNNAKHMIRAWLDLSAPNLFASLALLYGGTTLLLTAIVFASPLKGPIQSLQGVVAPFFNAVAVLFALLTGFLANDASERTRQAHRVVRTEVSELRNIYTLSVASISDMRTIRAAVKAYAASVVSDEWPAMENEMRSAPTRESYDALLQKVSDPAIAAQAGQAVHAALLTAAVRVGSARNERLTLNSDHTNELKWLTVLILSLITQLAIALVHIERLRAFLAALIVFSVAAVAALGIIACRNIHSTARSRYLRRPSRTLRSCRR
jgi:hypothetical protein